jgi:hypothetical protein
MCPKLLQMYERTNAECTCLGLNKAKYELCGDSFLGQELSLLI